MSRFWRPLQTVVSGGVVSTQDSAASWLLDMDGSGGSRVGAAGQNVTQSTAFSLAAYYACIRNISEDVAKQPLDIVRSVGNRREVVESHVLKPLLRRANPLMPMMAFRETLFHYALGWGNGFAEIERTGQGVPSALWPVHPSRVTIKYNAKLKALFYLIKLDNKTTVVYDSSDVFHLHGLGWDGIMGYSVLKFATESIGGALAAQRYSAAYFGNGAQAGAVLIHPKRLKPEQRENLRKRFDDRHKGAENAHNTVVLEEGVELQKTAIPPEESQFIETRQFQVEEICRWFRMPPHKIQHLLRATFTNIGSQKIEYVDDTLMPWATRFETEFAFKMFNSVTEGELSLKHNFDAQLRSDPAERSNYLRTLVTGTIMTPNEARQKEDLPPSPDPNADKLWIQGAMIPVDSVDKKMEEDKANKAQGFGKPPQEPEDEEEADDEEETTEQSIRRLHPMFLDVSRRALNKNDKAIEKAKRTRAYNSSVLATWADSFFSEQVEYLLEMLAPVLLSIRFKDYGKALSAVQSVSVSYMNEAKRKLLAGSKEPEQRASEKLAEALVLALIKEGCK